jgi:hypothetical protein
MKSTVFYVAGAVLILCFVLVPHYWAYVECRELGHGRAYCVLMVR